MSNYNKKSYADGVADVINYLSDIRKQRGISLRALASSIGVYENSVQQWLNPNTNISMDSLVRLGNALGVTFSTSNTRSYDCSAEQLVELLQKAKVYQELTTRDLAEMTGITQPGVAGILGHRIMPRLNAYLLLASAMGIELELYGED
jgi:transcriptional regulator with XRE-family HTH domain